MTADLPIDRSEARFRKPVRVSLTLPEHVKRALDKRAGYEGRSLSNLCSYLLERTVEDAQPFSA